MTLLVPKQLTTSIIISLTYKKLMRTHRILLFWKKTLISVWPVKKPFIVTTNFTCFKCIQTQLKFATNPTYNNFSKCIYSPSKCKLPIAQHPEMSRNRIPKHPFSPRQKARSTVNLHQIPINLPKQISQLKARLPFNLRLETANEENGLFLHSVGNWFCRECDGNGKKSELISGCKKFASPRAEKKGGKKRRVSPCRSRSRSSNECCAISSLFSPQYKIQAPETRMPRARE